MKTKLFVTGIALMALTAFAIAQEPGTGRGQRNGTGKGPAYVDTNNNNVCDNYENNTTRYGRHARGNARFQAVKGQRPGRGMAQNQGRGRGAGRGFVDADKNGICDRYEINTEK
ncbi:MAG: hypothetical protein JXQ80_07620 [Bacteroidales bacterium]|nr:hypothetical protein [Bacteroidales bacterium]